MVEIVVREAPDRLKELISYGTDFDRRADGNFDLVKEGGIRINEFYITRTQQAMKLSAHF